jgi:hypothetical protein
MQSYTEIPDTESLTVSRSLLLDNDKSVMSCFSGTTFPTSNLQVGMLCVRTDQNKLYELKDATPTWQFIIDLDMVAPWGQFPDLGAGVDLNALTDSGWYHQNNNASATLALHYPAALGGKLEVFTDGLMIYQTYQIYNSGELYVRTKYDTTWNPWRKQFDSTNLTSLSQLTNDTGALPAVRGAMTAYREIDVAANSGLAFNLDCNAANVFDITLTGNCTFAITNPPPATQVFSMTLKLTQDATGSRAVTWPASVIWPNGVAPSLTTTANKTDFVSLSTFDGGATWFGFPGQRNF